MDINDLIKYLLTPTAQVALIIGVAEVVKRLGWMPKNYIPVLDLGLGILSGVLVFGLMMGHGIGIGVIVGIAEGLSACGLFSGIKNVAEGIIEDRVAKAMGKEDIDA